MLAGSVHAHQPVLTTQRHHPFADRTTGADPALRQGLGHGGLVEKQQGRAEAGQTDY
ncbi:hypothetical protein D3C85_1664720 [compost metagenome]